MLLGVVTVVTVKVGQLLQQLAMADDDGDPRRKNSLAKFDKVSHSSENRVCSVCVCVCVAWSSNVLTNLPGCVVSRAVWPPSWTL